MVQFGNKLHQFEPIRLQGPPVIQNGCNKDNNGFFFYHSDMSKNLIRHIHRETFTGPKYLLEL